MFLYCLLAFWVHGARNYVCSSIYPFQHGSNNRLKECLLVFINAYKCPKATLRLVHVAVYLIHVQQSWLGARSFSIDIF